MRYQIIMHRGLKRPCRTVASSTSIAIAPLLHPDIFQSQISVPHVHPHILGHSPRSQHRVAPPSPAASTAACMLVKSAPPSSSTTQRPPAANPRRRRVCPRVPRRARTSPKTFSPHRMILYNSSHSIKEILLFRMYSISLMSILS